MRTSTKETYVCMTNEINFTVYTVGKEVLTEIAKVIWGKRGSNIARAAVVKEGTVQTEIWAVAAIVVVKTPICG